MFQGHQNFSIFAVTSNFRAEHFTKIILMFLYICGGNNTVTFPKTSRECGNDVSFYCGGGESRFLKKDTRILSNNRPATYFLNHNASIQSLG